LIFIDTGAFLARYLPHDQNHQSALLGWGQLATRKRPIFTSNFVLDEFFTLLGRRASYTFAAQRVRSILDSRELEILRPDEDIETLAVDLFEKFADQKVSYTDCTSFVLMRQRKIETTFSFDHHFALAGFVLWPEK
jgi:predicted nucleic acid-binding protein